MNSNSPRQFHKLYQKISDLGEGNFGSVGLYYSVEWRKEVAVKKIDKNGMPCQAIAAARQEAKNLSKLSTPRKPHPHIVQYYDYLETDPYIYLVMEYVPGGDLSSGLKKRSHYSEYDARSLICLLLKTVEYMHSKGIIHRDLKAANLLLSHTGDRTTIKLADFGISTRKRFFSLNEYAGTPTHMAPEIFDGKYGKEVDLWAIGIIAYQLLIGELPFYHYNNQELMRRIQKGKLSFHQLGWKKISSRAQDFIRRLLTVKPRERMTIQQALQHEWFALDLSRKTLTLRAVTFVYVAARKWRNRALAGKSTAEDVNSILPNNCSIDNNARTLTSVWLLVFSSVFTSFFTLIPNLLTTKTM